MKSTKWWSDSSNAFSKDCSNINLRMLNSCKKKNTLKHIHRPGIFGNSEMNLFSQ